MLFPPIAPQLSSPTSFLRTRQLEDLGTQTTNKHFTKGMKPYMLSTYLKREKENKEEHPDQGSL